MKTINEFLELYGEDTTSNFQLLKYAKELNIKPFYCIMRNELKKLKKLKEIKKEKYYIICNYQTTSQTGTHWIAMYKDKDKAFYFDSYGIQPFPEAINFLDNGVYSTFKIQLDNSKICGQLCLWILYKLSRGESFYDIILDLTAFQNFSIAD